MPRLVVVAALTTVALTGCTPALPEELATQLTEAGGCGDMEVFAGDEADEHVFVFQADGLVAAAQAAGEAVVTTFDFADGGASGSLLVGSAVASGLCTDVLMDGERSVDVTWEAVEGTATTTVTPDGDGARADVVLEGVVLSVGDGTYDLGDLEIADVSVGWLPG